VAQGVGPEFKPQYPPKKRKRKKKVTCLRIVLMELNVERMVSDTASPAHLFASEWSGHGQVELRGAQYRLGAHCQVREVR
jgi:hypothetical protein